MDGAGNNHDSNRIFPFMKPWPADKVERRKVADLVPYARNTRTHSDSQVEQIAASIREWGWTVPVLIDPDGGIIAGHGRIMAAEQLGIEEVPCMVAEGWTDAQRRAYVIADNKLTENGGWDEDLLKVEMKDLAALDFDLSLTGFPDLTVANFLASNGKSDPDEIPDVVETATSRSGDTWLLGNHRLRCGDSTSADDVHALLVGAAPHLMVTDPPYGVNYKPAWRNEAMPAKNDPARWKDGAGSPTGTVLNDAIADWREAWALFPGEVAYVWHSGSKAGIVADSLEACGFDIRAQIIWAKSQFVIGRGHYHTHHEPCWYAVKGKGHWQGSRKESTLWQIDHRTSDTGHRTQKPVECMARPIRNNSKVGDAVYEPFSGSGTTIIAGEMENRVIYAMELHPPYVDMAVRRWQEFSGQAATLEGDDRTFDDIAAERASLAV